MASRVPSLISSRSLRIQARVQSPRDRLSIGCRYSLKRGLAGLFVYRACFSTGGPAYLLPAPFVKAVGIRGKCRHRESDGPPPQIPIPVCIGRHIGKAYIELRYLVHPARHPAVLPPSSSRPAHATSAISDRRSSASDPAERAAAVQIANSHRSQLHRCEHGEVFCHVSQRHHRTNPRPESTQPRRQIRSAHFAFSRSSP
jgi:hypothetical protein